MAKQVLIITYYWPPSGGPGVQRWLKFAKYLPENGIDPVILTVDPEKAEYPIRDNSLLQDIRPDVPVFRTGTSGMYKLYKAFTRSKTAPYSGFANEGNPSLKQKISRFIRGNFFLPDARRGWNRFAYREAVSIIHNYGIDTVITTGPPMSTHLIGLKLKKHFSLKWIADFRDPWTDIFYYNKLYPTLPAKKVDRSYERNVLLNADQVITASAHLREQLLKKSDRIMPGKIITITNGYDAEEFTAATEKETSFTIAYTGTMTSDYTMDAFISAVRKLAAEKPIRLNFTGKVDPVNAKKLSDSLEGIVEFHPFLPHSEIIRVMTSASLLLLVIPNMPGYEGNLPGKLFEYLGSGTPILCLGFPEGEAASIIRDCDAGDCFDFYDSEGIYRFLETAFNAFKEHPEIQANTSVQRYSRKTLTQKLSQFITASD